MNESGGTVDPRITALIAEGVLREQCARCGCEAKFHEDRRCGVCADYCPYRPAYVPRPHSMGRIITTGKIKDPQLGRQP